MFVPVTISNKPLEIGSAPLSFRIAKPREYAQQRVCREWGSSDAFKKERQVGEGERHCQTEKWLRPGSDHQQLQLNMNLIGPRSNLLLSPGSLVIRQSPVTQTRDQALTPFPGSSSTYKSPQKPQSALELVKVQERRKHPFKMF